MKPNALSGVFWFVPTVPVAPDSGLEFIVDVFAHISLLSVPLLLCLFICAGQTLE